MSLRKHLAKANPEFREKVASRQYELSKVVISKKLELEMSQQTIANLLGVPYDRYLAVEGSSSAITVREYKEVLRELSQQLLGNVV